MEVINLCEEKVVLPPPPPISDTPSYKSTRDHRKLKTLYIQSEAGEWGRIFFGYPANFHKDANFKRIPCPSFICVDEEDREKVERLCEFMISCSWMNVWKSKTFTVFQLYRT